MKVVKIKQGLFFAVLSVFLTEGAIAEVSSYTIDDLRILVANKSWEELSYHLMDIVPSKRDSGWQDIVRQAAFARVRETQNSTVDDPSGAFLVVEDFHRKFSFLSDSAEWVELRRSTGRKYFENILRENNSYGPSVANYLSFVKSYPHDSALAAEAVEIVALSNSGVELVPFIGHFISISSDKETSCSNKRVWPALHAALSMNPGAEIVDVAKRLVLGDCWTALDSLTLDYLSRGGKESNYAKNLCTELKEKGRVSHFQNKSCEK